MAHGYKTQLATRTVVQTDNTLQPPGVEAVLVPTVRVIFCSDVNVTVSPRCFRYNKYPHDVAGSMKQFELIIVLLPLLGCQDGVLSVWIIYIPLVIYV
jgi:hypothetical protein